MAETVAVILAWVVAAVVVYPLIRPQKRRSTAVGHDAEVERLLVEKETVYAALKELEFDQQIGKLTREDYIELRRLYEARAIAVLEALDALEVPQIVDAAIEAEVAAARARREAVPTRAAFCVQCGTPLPSVARFCPQCGASAEGEASR